jgi:amino acid transporter
MIVTAGSIAHPTYIPTEWHIYLIFLLLLTLEALLAMQSTKFIGRLNLFGTAFNLLIIFIFVLWFPLGSVHSPRTNPSHAVWTTFSNTTSWPTPWATIMGFLTPLYTLSGFDAPFHLSEECSNSAIASPRAIVMTAQSGLYLGWAIILVIAYTVKDIPDVVSGQYGQPFGSLCLQVLGQRAGLALFSLSIIAQFSVAIGCTITATRIVFAFARDDALPGSKLWAKVNTRTKTPVNATWGVVVVAALIGLLGFAGPVTIGAVFSMGEFLPSSTTTRSFDSCMSF